MPQTYEGILDGDRIRWTGGGPTEDRPLRVRVRVLEDASGREEQGKQMAEALSKLADAGAFDEIDDPSEWQRDTRRDRSLPGRDD